MPRKREEITATPNRVNFRFDNPTGDVVILGGKQHVDGMDAGVTLKGTVEEGRNGEPEQPCIHVTYRFFGRWVEYRGKPQFAWDTFVLASPHGQAGVTKYLQMADGIGVTTAARLWSTFRGDAVKVLREDPELASQEVKGLSLEKAENASRYFQNLHKLEGVTIEMFDLIDRGGFPRTVVKKAIAKYGNKAPELLRHNPYLFMQWRGCYFKICDDLYLKLGGNASKLKRQALCAWYTLDRDSEGHTWHFIEVANQGIRGSVPAGKAEVEKALRIAQQAGIVWRTWTETRDGPPDPFDDGRYEWVAEGRKAKKERRLAGYVKEAMNECS